MSSRKIAFTTEGSSKTTPGSADESREFRVIDKRHFAGVESEGAVNGPVEVKPRYPTYVEELISKVADTERRFAERVKQIDQEIVRTKARLEADYERKLELARRSMVLPFLDVLDNLERALEAASTGGRTEDLIKGLRMTADMFRARLRAHAIEPLDVLDRPFDPAQSEAVGVIPVSDPKRDGLVIDVVLPGYRMESSLVRPAQVRVAQYQEDHAQSASS